MTFIEDVADAIKTAPGVTSVSLLDPMQGRPHAILTSTATTHYVVFVSELKPQDQL
jgi:hypothetical protein